MRVPGLNWIWPCSQAPEFPGLAFTVGRLHVQDRRGSPRPAAFNIVLQHEFAARRGVADGGKRKPAHGADSRHSVLLCLVSSRADGCCKCGSCERFALRLRIFAAEKVRVNCAM
jgi:hypothetical protein